MPKQTVNGIELSEPEITINGVALSFAEAMTLRVLVTVADLGSTVPGYAPHLAAIAEYMRKGMPPR